MKLWSGRKSAKDVLRCSFCNKSQRDVRKLITGPQVRICDGCVGICLEIISEDLQEARSGQKNEMGDTSCMICGNVVQADGFIQVGVLGKACHHCAEDVRDALLAWHQDHDGAAV